MRVAGASRLVAKNRQAAVDIIGVLHDKLLELAALRQAAQLFDPASGMAAALLTHWWQRWYLTSNLLSQIECSYGRSGGVRWIWS